jgi:hypothetical protein
VVCCPAAQTRGGGLLDDLAIELAERVAPGDLSTEAGNASGFQTDTSSVSFRKIDKL